MTKEERTPPSLSSHISFEGRMENRHVQAPCHLFHWYDRSAPVNHPMYMAERVVARALSPTLSSFPPLVLLVVRGHSPDILAHQPHFSLFL